MTDPERSRRNHLMPAVMLVALIFCDALGAHAAGTATPDDMARFLAGLPPASGSPLAPTANGPAWQRHAAELNAAWAEFEQRQVTRARVWAAATLPEPRGPMFYMFGGPDFVHAEAFYPDASTYVLSGLEPVGPRPEALALPEAALGLALSSLRRSLSHFMRYGYFITSEMDSQLRAGKFAGTLPVLYVFLARSGKTIRGAEYVSLDARGEAVPAPGARRPMGVKITFSGAGGRPGTLTYFSTDLSNDGVAKSKFLEFCGRLGKGQSLVKSASYLMHLENFSKVREFLLQNSAVIVQDDSGIPLKYFAPASWRLRPYGRYLGPTDEFKRFHQPEMARLFRKGARPVNFGIGYRWHPQRTNILVAERLPPQ